MKHIINLHLFCKFSWGDMNNYSPRVGHWQHTKETAPYKSSTANQQTCWGYKGMGDSGSAASLAGPPQHGQWLTRAASPGAPYTTQAVPHKILPPVELCAAAMWPWGGPVNCTTFLASWGFSVSWQTLVLWTSLLPLRETVSIKNQLQNGIPGLTMSTFSF